MCGIAGIITKSPSEKNHRPALEAMSKALQHRGPDGEGFYLSEPNAGFYLQFKSNGSEFVYSPQRPLPEHTQSSQVQFLHRRLSIIDLSAGGHQPMCDVSQAIWLTYNGEIYNYIELREELQAKGHTFKSTSDSEVLIAAYREWGFDCCSHFNGMWAFCLHDRAKNICFASRDRLGVKPFYYTETPTEFVFASEQKALVRGGFVKASANERQLADYFMNGALEQQAENFFEGIIELMPGTSLLYELATHRHSVHTWYVLANHVSQLNNHLSNRELSHLFRKQLDDAVRIRLRSDVPVGTCLSGGIDSSALAVFMARHSIHPVHCFTAVFKSGTVNEESYAESVALMIRGMHHKVEPSAAEFFADIDALIYSQDVPIWSSSTYAQHRVMQLAQQNGIKVVLDGQGADELFAGYHHHFLARWKELSTNKKKSEILRELLSPGKSIPVPLLFFLKQHLKHALGSKQEAGGLLQRDFMHQAQPRGNEIFDTTNGQLLDDITKSRLKIFLKCEDRAGMWHSVESRTPFSDDLPLIETAFSFEGSRKIQNGISKYFLREAAKPFLPEEVYRRYDKVGFETPYAGWINEGKDFMLEEILAAKHSFVNQNALENLKLNTRTNRDVFFKLYVYSKWKKLFSA